MKESEAKTKWCPHTLHEAMNGTAGTKCIGSDCMMFEWFPDNETRLSNGMVVITDIDDVDITGNRTWGWSGRYVKHAGDYLHQLITEKYYGKTPEGYVVDHIDGNQLNNRSGNLRICTQAENIANSKSRGGKSKYRGVYKSRNGKWVAQLSSNGERFCIGTFDNEVDAAKAWDKKATEVHGEYANLNLSVIENSGRCGDCGLKTKGV